MGAIIIFLLLMLSLALQGSLLALVSPNGVHPDLLLVVVVALALLSDSKRGALVGLVAGLMQDIVFGAPLGFFASIKMLVGAMAGFLAEEINRDFVLAPMLLVIPFSLFNDLMPFILSEFAKISQPFPLLQYLQQHSAGRMLMHFFIMGLIYPYLCRAQKRRLLFPQLENPGK
ncbi:MAG: rod shape-determining protein MreD [Dethiobacter sp.]|jgi:rod shape-determining protein MreD|nr:rod shape-determining protein MreD [Dethiobacter sp.]MBS3901178.1 rod shape-determining protein MreD [Dethiobacter sp.]MBS3989130.1 rod shape-determining protein MreD [Dethiobacter sp.]